jgi:molybdopterin molybdotransferase
MAQVATYTFRDARNVVIEQVLASRVLETEETVLETAASRVLAEDVVADRDYPATARSIRDGFAVRAADLPGRLEIAGEVRAGQMFRGEMWPGQCVEIMTGAPVPRGADAVVMVEHVTRNGAWIETDRAVKPGEFVNPQGSEARQGQAVVNGGRRLGFAEVAMLATVGKTRVRVYKQPRVAILPTGDEVVPIGDTPRSYQVRNSNTYALSAQVRSAGAQAVTLPIAEDEYQHTRWLVEKGLQYDMLVMSGGVSAGKYDLVEEVLADCGAEFFFDRVLIQPGQPLVFGRAQGKFVFGLPGNPASTMVTFELFARAAVELLGGQRESTLSMPLARLTQDFRHKTGLTRFLPARVSADGTQVTPVPWSGSSDVPAITRSNAFLVAESDHEQYKAGDLIQVMLKWP